MRHMNDDHTNVRDFFGARAARWDARFPDDGPAYEAAVAEMGLRPGDRVLDAGCGTGRALAPLRSAVTDTGVVLGADLTPAMLEAAVGAGRDGAGRLLLADVTALPLRSASLDAVFAAGLVAHLPDPGANLRELGRVVRPGGVLALFHPIGRSALAARQGRRAHAGGPAGRAQPAPAAGRFGLDDDLLRGRGVPLPGARRPHGLRAPSAVSAPPERAGRPRTAARLTAGCPATPGSRAPQGRGEVPSSATR